MYTIIKKIKTISLFLCTFFLFSMILTSCINDSVTGFDTYTGNFSPDITETVEKPDAIDITVFNFYGDSNKNIDMRLSFENYVSSRYGIDFNFNTPGMVNYPEEINRMALAGDLTGLVYLFSKSEMISWAKEGKILSLDEYLKDNTTWNDLVPQEWKDCYSWDGKVWGIPKGASTMPSYWIRLMRGDWLEAVNMVKPETINQFYETVKAFTYNDPDRNNIHDTWGFVSSANTWLFQDIFQAFDARVNRSRNFTPVWNPNNNIWEDSVLKPGMAEACAFLRKCLTEGILNPDISRISTTQALKTVSNGQAGSCFYWDFWIINIEEDIKSDNDEGYLIGVAALTHKISEKINYWTKSINSPYVLMADTEQPKEVINWFVNLMWGSPESFFTFMYGIQQESKSYKEGFYLDGKTVYRLYYQIDDITGSVKEGAVPEIVYGHPDYSLDIGSYGYLSAYNSGNAVWDYDYQEKNRSDLNRLYNIFNEYNDGRLYLLNESLSEADNDEYTAVSYEWAEAFLKYIDGIVIQGLNPDVALKTYLSTIMKFDPQATLDAMNARLNKTSEQDYETIWSSMN